MTVRFSAEVRDILTSGRPAHLVTLNPDGSPQVSVVWIGLDGDAVVFGHIGEWRKVRNIRRDPRVALSILTGTRVHPGFDDYLVITGTARTTDGGAPELLRRLAEVYVGPGSRFPPLDAAPGHVTRISPTDVGRPGLPSWAEPH